MLFGREVQPSELSDGQKVLLQFCVAIDAQAEKLSELIIIMDEPENHLHPQAVLEAVEAIQKALTKGQLWIATHSIPLLAHFDSESIWWMEKGGVCHAGTKPETVLRGLVGDDVRIAKLQDFLGLPAALASVRFAHQCLIPPAIVGSAESDPQTTQIQQVLAAMRPGETLRLLDYGAGRGRLADALAAEAVTDAATRYDYRAFDVSDAHRAECEAAVTRLCGSAADRWFSDAEALKAVLGLKSVDVLVLCNVLHEIPVSDWLSMFGEHGLIRMLLREDGSLLLVEDAQLPVGEKAHAKGFLVLNTAELFQLFDFKPEESGYARSDVRGDGRLLGHLIPARCLARLNKETLGKTLKSVQADAIDRIKVLRALPPSYPNGRKHAFHVQQLANATLELIERGE